jgi:hypothetical protein
MRPAETARDSRPAKREAASLLYYVHPRGTNGTRTLGDPSQITINKTTIKPETPKELVE